MKKALEGVRRGIVVKRYDGGINDFRGYDSVYLVFFDGEYQLIVRGRGGMLKVDDYGITWALEYPEFTSEKQPKEAEPETVPVTK